MSNTKKDKDSAKNSSLSTKICTIAVLIPTKTISRKHSKSKSHVLMDNYP